MSVHLKKREEVIKNGRNRTSRPKTFKTQAAAESYAKKEGIKEFTLKNLKSELAATAKFRIEVKN